MLLHHCGEDEEEAEAVGKESRASSHARTTVVCGDNISEAKVATHLVLLMFAGERRETPHIILTAAS